MALSHGRKSIRATAEPRALMEREEIAGAWTARVITLFPETFPGVLGASLTGKALKEGRWQLHTTDLRLFGEGKHRNVDDKPAGGGAGMVLRADIVGRAVEAAAGPGPILYMSPRGAPFSQAMARDLAAGPGCTVLCGRFEGVDERAIAHYGMQEVSIGDYVLTGGELAAQVLLDACIRLLPGVLGNEASTEEESHSAGLLEHPHFTRPAEWQGRTIPDVLTCGDHGKVAAWRREQSEALTKARRPDLWDKLHRKE